jgi:outer membrane lipoprotein-sorting protein
MIKGILPIVIVLFPMISMGQNAGNESRLQTLMDRLAAVNTTRVSFLEIRDSVWLEKPIQIKGTLSYHAPDVLEKHTTEPLNERFIARGDIVSVERVVKEKIQRKEISLNDFPPLKPFIISLRATLAGDLSTLKQHYQIKLKDNSPGWRLLLEPTDSNIRKRVKEITIDGKQDHIDVITIIEASGDSSKMILTPL